MGRGKINLTVIGSNARNRMVTEQTLDREGFYIPKPPQRCDRRVKSAIERRADFKKVYGSSERPKSSCTVPSNRAESEKKQSTKCHSKSSNRIQNENDFTNSVKAQKMSVNQKWTYKGEEPKWKPRRSHVNMTERSPKSDNKNITKQRITVCEVMAKMHTQPEFEGTHNHIGSSAPPSSPKGSDRGSPIIGQRFTNMSPFAPKQTSGYMNYTKSKSQLRSETPCRTSYAYLQEDMTIKSAPQKSDSIHIPTGGSFSTDEPDEESSAVIDCWSAQQHPAKKMPQNRPQSSWKRTRSLHSDVYKSLYVKDYQDRECIPQSKLYRQKCDNVRYTPDTYRFSDRRYSTNTPSHEWDRCQPRPTVHTVSTRRPSRSLHVS